MFEKILEIKEFENTGIEDDFGTGYEGYVIVTDEQDISILISNTQDCCESWGHMTIDESDKEYFVGANITDIKIVGTNMVVRSILERLGDLDGGDACFINIETDKGLLQITLYNNHNGYYGHSYVIISNQLNHNGVL